MSLHFNAQLSTMRLRRNTMFFSSPLPVGLVLLFGFLLLSTIASPHHVMASEDSGHPQSTTTTTPKCLNDEDVECITPDPQVLNSAQNRQGTGFAKRWQVKSSSTPVFNNINETVKKEILMTLMKPEIGSVVITGENGVGKTAMANAIAYAIQSGNVPSKLRGYSLLVVDLGALSSGGEHPGVIEAKIQEMVEISRREKVIWIMDEIHSIRGQGTHAANNNDVFQWMKPHMTNGTLRILGTSTHEEYLAAFGGDASLTDRLQEVKMPQPEGQDLILIIKNWVSARYNMDLNEQIIWQAVQLSNEYAPIGNQPRKTTTLFEQAFSILDYEDRGGDLDGDTLKEAVKLRWNIADDYFDFEKRRALVQNLGANLRKYIVEQNEAVTHIENAAKYALSKINERNGVQLALILAGPPGTGKTETVMAYGKAMKKPVHRIMMSKYATPKPGDVEELKFEIMQAIRKNPFTVLFFDEIEKCPVHIQDGLLDILDSGRFSVRMSLDTTRNNNRTVMVDVSKADVFLGTNAGTEYIFSLSETKPGMGFNPSAESRDMNRQKLIEHMLADNVSRPLLDRTNVIPYLPLSRQGFSDVIRMKIKGLLQDFSNEHHIKILFSENELSRLSSDLTAKYYKPNLSVRALRKILDESVRGPISEAVVQYGIGSEISISYLGKSADGKNSLTVEDNTPCVRYFSSSFEGQKK